MSFRTTSPSTSCSLATMSMSLEMSQPIQWCPASVRQSPLRPLPQPTSSTKQSSLGSARSSSARSVRDVWISRMRELVAYLEASSRL